MFILNKLLTKKTTPDSEEERAMVYDVLLERRDENELKGISKAQQNALMNTRKEELLEFTESIFDKLIEGKIDIDDSSNRFFCINRK